MAMGGWVTSWLPIGLAALTPRLVRCHPLRSLFGPTPGHDRTVNSTRHHPQKIPKKPLKSTEVPSCKLYPNIHRKSPTTIPHFIDSNQPASLLISIIYHLISRHLTSVINQC